MDEETRKIAVNWRAMLNLLIRMEGKWEETRQIVLSTPRDAMAELPLEVQKAVAKWGKMEFRKALPEMYGHLWATGGLREHLKMAKEGN